MPQKRSGQKAVGFGEAPITRQIRELPPPADVLTFEGSPRHTCTRVRESVRERVHEKLQESGQAGPAQAQPCADIHSRDADYPWGRRWGEHCSFQRGGRSPAETPAVSPT